MYDYFLISFAKLSFL